MTVNVSIRMPVNLLAAAHSKLTKEHPMLNVHGVNSLIKSVLTLYVGGHPILGDYESWNYYETNIRRAAPNRDTTPARFSEIAHNVSEALRQQSETEDEL